MTAKPAIALYLGESFATIGLFDDNDQKKSSPLFEKSIFLPQVTLKSLFQQTKNKINELWPSESHSPISIYVVTKYFDRLKQFRLGGSISQIILKDFENSYSLQNSKLLSLAASQLIIKIDPSQFSTAYLSEELERVKKINPDLNKAVLALPENKISSAIREQIYTLLTETGLKIFNCASPLNQNSLRKTLLNAGSEGTKEELLSDLKEVFGENAEIKFFLKDTFSSDFENVDLFFSFQNFLANLVLNKKINFGAYFDIESIKFISTEKDEEWLSPWGYIRTTHYRLHELHTHPFTEVKLNDFSVLQAKGNTLQLEPGPVIAGRAIKPLLIDLFFEELRDNSFVNDIFTQLQSDALKSKLNNLFSALEKAQKNNLLSVSINELKENIRETILNEIRFRSEETDYALMGPLVDIFCKNLKQNHSETFSWPKEIMKMRDLRQ